MVNVCRRCQKPLNVPPSSGKKYCSIECRLGEYQKPCPICGELFTTNDTKKSPKTCGKPSCSKSRKLSSESKDRIASTLSGLTKKDGLYTQTCKCGVTFLSKTTKRKLCPNCFRKSKKDNSVSNKFSKEELKVFAYKSLSNHNSSSNRTSKAEAKFSDLLPFGFVKNDRKLLSGLEIDFLYDNLAVEYHGTWHYVGFHDHYKSTVERDRKKHQMLMDLNFIHYIVGWINTISQPQDFDSQHAFYIGQLFEDVSPFKFLYNRKIMIGQYNKLCRSKAKRGYLCSSIIDWFHNYRWFQSTKTHGISSVQCWLTNRDKILSNRQKYASLSSNDLRRYFLLFDYAPSTFPEVFAKYLASKISGDTIVDPFAGYGNRMLGVTASGKKYIGYDINPYAVNANRLIAHELELNAEILKCDSSKTDQIEADGIITCPPYDDKDNYGYKSPTNYYDMIRETFSKIIVRDKGFVVVKVIFISSRKQLVKSAIVLRSIGVEWVEIVCTLFWY